MTNNQPLFVYLDTNVYARLFDDQTQPTIQAESDAFLTIIESVNSQRFELLSSDILLFEIHNILNENKREKVLQYINLCTHHIDSTDQVLGLGKQIQQQCFTRARDALHIASAMHGKARYFLSCDKTVTMMKHAKCYRRFGKSFRDDYFSVMDPIRFIKQFKKGEL